MKKYITRTLIMHIPLIVLAAFFTYITLDIIFG